MTKKEIYFVIFFLLGLIFVFFFPVWLSALDILPSWAISVTAGILYFLFGIGSFSIASIPLFIRLKIKEKGKLTKRFDLSVKILVPSLFVFLATLSFLTFLLPLIVDYPASCCPVCPSNYACWVGRPVNTTLLTTLVIGFSILSALSLPFFVLVIRDWVKTLRRKNASVSQVKNA